MTNRRLGSFLGLLGATAIVCAAAIPVSSAPPGPPKGTVIMSISGSNTIGDALGPALVMGFMKDKLNLTNVRRFPDEGQNSETTDIVVSGTDAGGKTLIVRISTPGSMEGLKAIARGEADIVASSTTYDDKTAAQICGADNKDRKGCQFRFAYDAVAVLVNKSNPVTELSLPQLKQVFDHTITNWSQVPSGRSGDIILVARNGSSGTTDFFKSKVWGDKKHPFADAVHQKGSSAEIRDTIASLGGAIGYVGQAFRGPNKALKLSAADGQTAYELSEATVKRGQYPLGRPLYFYVQPSSVNALVKPFLRYVLSERGQAVVRDKSFYDRGKLGTAAPNIRMPRLKQVFTMTVSFQPNSAQLAEDLSSEVDDIADQYRTGKYACFIVVGYGEQPARTVDRAAARRLAADRAKTVARILWSKGIVVKDENIVGLPDAPPDSQTGADIGICN
jgi:phosphate transport system substrate-binding protein